MYSGYGGYSGGRWGWRGRRRFVRRSWGYKGKKGTKGGGAGARARKGRMGKSSTKASGASQGMVKKVEEILKRREMGERQIAVGLGIGKEIPFFQYSMGCDVSMQGLYFPVAVTNLLPRVAGRNRFKIVGVQVMYELLHASKVEAMGVHGEVAGEAPVLSRGGGGSVFVNVMKGKGADDGMKSEHDMDEVSLVGDKSHNSLVYQGQTFRFPFVSGGDAVPLRIQEVGRIRPLAREKVLRMAAAFASEPEPWDRSFLEALEREGAVVPGTAAGYFVKLGKLERGGSGLTTPDKMEIDSNPGEHSVDEVAELLGRLGMDDD